MADDDEEIRVEVTLRRRQLEALMRWNAPAEYVGESIEDRIAFLVDDQAVRITESEREKAQKPAPPVTPPRLLQ